MPLCFTRTNPTKYCSVSHNSNNTFLYPFPDSLLEHSIFRHILSADGDTLVHNWMMDGAQEYQGWDQLRLDLDDTSHFWFAASAVNSDRYFWGPKSLLFTITFRIEDTMTICLDSCLWPPSTLLRVWDESGGGDLEHIYLPCCFSITYPGLGDLTADGVVNVGDVVFLTNYLYRQGTAPPGPHVGDVNCDQVVDVGDVVFLINYLFRGGSPPSC